MNTLLPIPGFVDLQVNGFMGIDFSSPDLTAESFSCACQNLLQSGTAAFLPTIITSPIETYRRNLPIMAKAIASPEFQGKLLGIHLEGPFISSQLGAVGAHNPNWTRMPDIKLLQQINDWAEHTIRVVTIAAELEGASELAQAAVDEGMVVSIGHTLGTAADLHRLAQAGARALTHLGNGIGTILHKFTNPIWSGLADDDYTAMFIGDGHHLPDGVLKSMLRAKGMERAVIVSDASPIAGMPPGEYITLGNRVILESSGRLYNPEKGHLVGSSATLLKCMNHLAAAGFLSPDELMVLGFDHPLRLINFDLNDLKAESKLFYDQEQKIFSTD
jgi:N-acetylglucosamine-6-phosphate deacetylase